MRLAARETDQRRKTWLWVMALLFLPLSSGAQTGATVTGKVLDEQGAALPAANVALSSGGPTRFQVTGPDGRFLFANVAPGNYKLAVHFLGFTPATKDVPVNGTGTVEIPPITLAIAVHGEEVIVTASKVESTVLNAPAAVSVVNSDTIATSPAQNYGDLLRQVPGLNVIQMSARDINLTSREPTNTLSNSELVLLDGRSIYLDFFGLVLWDFVPTNPDDIKQIEVVRGPASAIWGANALTGVVNIITKTPREAPGGSLTLTGGAFSRDAGSTKGQGLGGTYGASLSYAAAPNDTWSYKFTGGYFHSEAFARPTGVVPIGVNPADPTNITGGGPYPPFPNEGTKQPRVTGRVDQELADGGHMSYEAGYAGTQGIVHTGIGPFDIQSGSYLAYGRVGFNMGGLKLNAFGNFVDTKAPNLLQKDAFTGRPLELDFKTQTYDLEAGYSRALGERNILTVGGNARRNNFNITIAPNGQNRNEFGGYAQDELFLDKVRFSLGARVDKFGNLDKAIFSPRLAVILKPIPTQAIRLSFNKAFRAPSLINNFLDIHTIVPVDLSGLAPLLPPPFRPAVVPPFNLVVHSAGSEVRRASDPSEAPLREESIKAYEVGYTGTFEGKTTVEAAFYIDDRDDSINFVTSPAIQVAQNIPGSFYTSQNPPPGWFLPPVLLDILAQSGHPLPAQFTYLNLGPYRQKGLELSVSHAFTRAVSAFANYSYQFDPQVKSSPNPFPAEKLAFPPSNRFNAGVTWNDKRYLGSLSVNYSDRAFWTDVLTDAFHGFTDSYTMINASFGMRFVDGRVTLSVKGTNLANKDIQQHIFGDIIKRNIYGELRVNF
jgi:outer membrane receptor for ferrienterochelin and colicins